MAFLSLCMLPETCSFPPHPALCQPTATAWHQAFQPSSSSSSLVLSVVEKAILQQPLPPGPISPPSPPPPAASYLRLVPAIPSLAFVSRPHCQLPFCFCMLCLLGEAPVHFSPPSLPHGLPGSLCPGLTLLQIRLSRLLSSGWGQETLHPDL
ncbi:hypothetical protein E2320_011850 [Naja naja]|nr:hypothetical protein E2320_011850 [Naja naja]